MTESILATCKLTKEEIFVYFFKSAAQILRNLAKCKEGMNNEISISPIPISVFRLNQPEFLILLPTPYPKCKWRRRQRNEILVEAAKVNVDNFARQNGHGQLFDKEFAGGSPTIFSVTRIQ